MENYTEDDFSSFIKSALEVGIDKKTNKNIVRFTSVPLIYDQEISNFSFNVSKEGFLHKILANEVHIWDCNDLKRRCHIICNEKIIKIISCGFFNDLHYFVFFSNSGVAIIGFCFQSRMSYAKKFIRLKNDISLITYEIFSHHMFIFLKSFNTLICLKIDFRNLESVSINNFEKNELNVDNCLFSVYENSIFVFELLSKNVYLMDSLSLSICDHPIKANLNKNYMSVLANNGDFILISLYDFNNILVESGSRLFNSFIVHFEFEIDHPKFMYLGENLFLIKVSRFLIIINVSTKSIYQCFSNTSLVLSDFINNPCVERLFLLYNSKENTTRLETVVLNQKESTIKKGNVNDLNVEFSIFKKHMENFALEGI